MTSNTFRQTRRKSNKRGGYVTSLYNAATASLLPVGLTLSQQYYKNKNYKNRSQRKRFTRSPRR